MSSARAAWSTPADIVAAIGRLWDSGAMLAARLDGAALFPQEVRLRQPGVAAIRCNKWLNAVRSASRVNVR